MPVRTVLNPEVIVAAYQGGYFPMPDPDTGEILWFNPDPRAVIPLDQFHISRSLARTARKKSVAITFNRDFEGVIGSCAERVPTWISPEIKDAYLRLHQMGLAHSVEVWRESRLIGGLYGVAQGAAFNAESMFSKATDTSKLALWALVQRMRELGMLLLEVQFMTEHLKRLGAVEVSKDQYLRQLGAALDSKVRFSSPVGVYNLL